MSARLTDAQAKFIANVVLKAKETQGLSNQEIAEKAGYNEKVVRDIINRRCRTYKTVEEVCEVLSIKLQASLEEAGLHDDSESDHSPNELGGYSREIYRRHVGIYTTVRPAYADPNRLKLYVTEIDWDSAIPALRFTERRTDSLGQNGHIYIAPTSAYMYLMTIKQGWVRTVLVSQLVNNSSIMRGIILSQFNISGANHAPVCAPIVYIKDDPAQRPFPDDEIEQSDQNYGRYRQLLDDTIAHSYVKILTAGHVHRAVSLKGDSSHGSDPNV